MRGDVFVLSERTLPDGSAVWAPAVPMPLYVGPFLLLKRCECGRTFLTLKAYEKHYYREHICGTTCQCNGRVACWK